MDEGLPPGCWQGDDCGARFLATVRAWRAALARRVLRAQDSTFDFERLRNRPVKYDRELMKKTVRAMERVQARATQG